MDVNNNHRRRAVRNARHDDLPEEAGMSEVLGNVKRRLNFLMRTSPSNSNADLIPAARLCLWLLSYTLVSGALYFFATHDSSSAVQLLMPGVIDGYVPIIPATVPLYMSYLLIMPVLFWLGRRNTWLLPAFFSGALATGACLLMHFFWNTAIVRDAGDSAWLAWLYSIDPPLAISPSGHVALPVALCCTLAALRQRLAWLFAGWSAMLAVTVLTTGQHLFLDTAFGMVLGIVAGCFTAVLVHFRVNLRTMGAILLEWMSIVLALRMAVVLQDWRIDLLVFVLVASRQHAIFILFHDAVHFHLSRHRYVNDFLINVAIGIPTTVLIEFYRPLHLEHHRHVGTERDPERRYLYAGQRWKFHPLDAASLCRQLLGDLFLLNTWRTMRAYRAAGNRLHFSTRPMWSALAVWLIIAGFLIYACEPSTIALLALLWFGPLATLGALLQKIRSLAEHSGGPGVTPGWQDWTYSWKVGMLARMFIWPYHINLHLQHHRAPNVAWHDLPKLVQAQDQSLQSSALLGMLCSNWPRAAGAEQHRLDDERMKK